MEKRKGKKALMATPIKLHECLTNSDIAKLEFKTSISNKTIKKIIIVEMEKRRKKKERRRSLWWRGEEECDEDVTQKRKEKGEEGVITNYLNTPFSTIFFYLLSIPMAQIEWLSSNGQKLFKVWYPLHYSRIFH